MTIVFRVILCLLGLIAIGTGFMDFWYGVAAQEGLGAVLGEGADDAALNNTFRFFSAIWMGFGVFLILFSTDLKHYFTALITAFLIVIAGGIGRLMSVNEFGVTVGRETGTWAIIILEIVIIPLLLVWLIKMKPSLDEMSAETED